MTDAAPPQAEAAPKPGVTGADTAAVAVRLIRESIPPRWKLYGAMIVCILGVAGFTAALAYSTRVIVNDVFVAADTAAALGAAALIVGVTLGKAGFTYANSVVSLVFKRSITAGYQKTVFRRMIAKDAGFFARDHAAGQMAQVRLFGNAAGKIVTGVANTMAMDILTVIALFGVMLMQDAWMTLFCTVFLPLIFFTVSRLSKRVRDLATAEREADAAYIAIGAEAFEGIKTVKSYGLETKTVDRFERAVTALEDRMLSIARVTSATSPMMELLGGLVVGLFVVYAAWQTIAQGETPGEFTAFLTAFLMAYQPASRLSKIYVEVQKNLIHAQRMFRLIDAPPVLRAEGGADPSAGAPAVAFENVSFVYKGGSPALQDVTLEIAPGERVAVIGRSGAGKSTLIDLVQRFHDPSSGTVRIGGHDLRDTSPEGLRRTVALTSQDVFLFDATLAENVRDGRPDATDAQVADALERAALTDVVAALPKGIDTIVGPGGKSLSGGQRQRVGIARALLKDAPVTIFDEATAALDVETERRVLEAVAGRARADRTLIFVTHRPATLDYVDRILLLDGGRLVAAGTREELEQGSADYRTLLNLALEAEG
ncbi:ABC transporter ATP-binding protein [Jannaschia sp. Os4]|uniref:ABC transporter ATP-binding protein n=1 Tax=Jannaschia sp. Os4 TaxID=2807617 RepID=UPI0019397D44|nr:ABC transporter ATP-binding protein [Jannaschia sp. Os4]MBM2578010.1 ABC transporter ATP-binding protein [Jannaschia sp. Os4]